MRPGRVPPVSRGRRCSPGRQEIPGRRLPLRCGQPLHPAYTTHPARLTHNETSTEVHAFTRPVCPLPVTPGWNRSPSAFPRASHPTVTGDARRGWGQASSTDLVLHSRHRPDLRSASTLATCDLVSQFLFGVDADHGLDRCADSLGLRYTNWASRSGSRPFFSWRWPGGRTPAP